MAFNEINLQEWPRGQIFYYFSKMAPTSYSMTVDIDVTELLRGLKAARKKFFPTYLWLITKCLNRQEEFKVAYRDGRLGYYDTLTPLYAQFYDDDKTFSLMWTEFNDSYEAFYDAYIENQNNYGMNRGVLCQPQTPPPENAYTVSCVPWISFRHFAVHTHDNKDYYFPSVEAGKFYENAEGRMLLPLSLTCHHATTDGYHIKGFLDALESEISEPVESIKIRSMVLQIRK